MWIKTINSHVFRTFLIANKQFNWKLCLIEYLYSSSMKLNIEFDSNCKQKISQSVLSVFFPKYIQNQSYFKHPSNKLLESMSTKLVNVSHFSSISSFSIQKQKLCTFAFRMVYKAYSFNLFISFALSYITQ